MDSHGISILLDTVIGFASVQAKCGDIQRALRFTLVTLAHPALVREAKVRADTLTAKLKERLTLEEIEAAQRLAQGDPFESVVKEILD